MERKESHDIDDTIEANNDNTIESVDNKTSQKMPKKDGGYGWIVLIASFVR